MPLGANLPSSPEKISTAKEMATITTTTPTINPLRRPVRRAVVLEWVTAS